MTQFEVQLQREQIPYGEIQKVSVDITNPEKVISMKSASLVRTDELEKLIKGLQSSLIPGLEPSILLTLEDLIISSPGRNPQIDQQPSIIFPDPSYNLILNDPQAIPEYFGVFIPEHYIVYNPAVDMHLKMYNQSNLQSIQSLHQQFEQSYQESKIMNN